MCPPVFFSLAMFILSTKKLQYTEKEKGLFQAFKNHQQLFFSAYLKSPSYFSNHILYRHFCVFKMYFTGWNTELIAMELLCRNI